jgi:hypothetical protein
MTKDWGDCLEEPEDENDPRLGYFVQYELSDVFEIGDR